MSLGEMLQRNDELDEAEQVLRKLNKFCFTICIVCIICGTVLSLVMIWAEIHDHEIIWKSWLTIAVFFLASALTLSVNKTLQWNRKGDDS